MHLDVQVDVLNLWYTFGLVGCQNFGKFPSLGQKNLWLGHNPCPGLDLPLIVLVAH